MVLATLAVTMKGRVTVLATPVITGANVARSRAITAVSQTTSLGVLLFKLLRDCAGPAAKSQSPNNKQQRKGPVTQVPPPDPQNQIIVRGLCHHKEATFFVDTGSSVSLISKAFVDSLSLTDQILKTKATLTSFTQHTILTYGEITLAANIANCSVSYTFIVTDLVDTTCLLGLPFLMTSNINVDVRRRVLSL